MNLNEPQAQKEFQLGTIVEAVNLKTQHLNKQIGAIVIPEDSSSIPSAAKGRVGVLFPTSKDCKPKLLKPCNLKEVHFNPSKNDHRARLLYDYKSNLHPDVNVEILVENGAGHECTHCKTDLDGKCHIIKDGKYWCEQHYVQTFLPSIECICLLCRKYISAREQKQPALYLIRENVYPSGTYADGTPLPFYGDTDVCWVHAKCFTCTLCDTPLADDRRLPHGFSMKKIEETDSVEFYCMGPPSSCGCCSSWCNDAADDYKAAMIRLKELQGMSSTSLQEILAQRNVPVLSEEEHSSLVRKCIVTDKAKGRKTHNIVTHTNTQGKDTHHKVSSRSAPGAALMNRKCSHGPPHKFRYDDTPLESAKRAVVSSLITLRHTKCNEGWMPITDYCIEHSHILKRDLNEKFIPKLLWASAVDSAISEDGGFFYELTNVTLSLISESIIDLLSKTKKSTITRFDVYPLFSSPEWLRQMAYISESQENLYEFMHCPDRRPCSCMQYVATAAEIGRLRKKDMRVSNAKTCAMCNTAMVKPMYCSRCEKVAYCSRSCQKDHWKSHKKVCKSSSRKVEA